MAVNLKAVGLSKNLTDLNNGYTTIEVKQNYPANFAGGAGAGFSPDTTYVLPLPKGATDIFENSWEASAFETGAGAFISGAPGAAIAQTVIGAMRDTIGAGVDAFQSGATQEARNAGSIKTGLLINPNTQLMYKTPTIRQLQFTWALVPASKGAADVISAMIKDLRKTSYPTFAIGSLLYPGIFRVSLYGLSSSGGQNILMKTYPSALISLQVNYDTEGAPYIHDDGKPVTTTITLGFQELKILGKTDIVDLYGA